MARSKIVSCWMLMSFACLCFFFFFQAEDGIRDKLVTGVQTCALPISRVSELCLARAHRRRGRMGSVVSLRRSAGGCHPRCAGLRAARPPASMVVARANGADCRIHGNHQLGIAGILAPPLRTGDKESAVAGNALATRRARGHTMTYLIVKWLHVLSSTVLFGTGLGSAYYMFCASRTRDARTAAVVVRYVVLADWLFTTTTIIVQPLTGLFLVHLAGIPLN